MSQSARVDVDKVNALIPSEGVQHLQLRCTVCPNIVPFKRATQKRFQGTCSPECGAVVKRWNKYNRENRFCPRCMHPTSPEERRAFVAWRKSLLTVQPAGRGRPPVKRVELLEGALREAIGAMAGEEFDELRTRFEILVDGKRQKGSILAPNGSSASSEPESEEAHYAID